MTRLKSILAAVAAMAATLAGLALACLTALLPPEVAKWLVVIPSAAAVVVHLAQGIRADLDKLGLLVVVSATLLLPGCAGWSIDIRSPYGDASSVDGGPLSISPRPLIIPTK
jgi:hypothetical protein